MSYLDYFMYTILIILFVLLLNKIVINEGFVAKKPEKKINYDKNGLVIEDPEEPPPPDPQWLTIVKINYRIAGDVAIMLIKMPYKFLNMGVTMLQEYIEHINNILKPVYKTIKQMFNIFTGLFKKILRQFLNVFKMGFNILGDLPTFIKENAERAINFITDMIEQFTSTIKTVLDIFQKIFDLLLKIPTMIFTLLNQVITMLFNVVIMIIKLPESLMGMIIGLQEQSMSLMDKSFSIPFTDMFFK